jgi:hypothetical protein
MNKRLVVSVGLAAMGISGAQATDVPGLDSSVPKPWSISGTLRGFYDDNFRTQTEGNKQHAWGYEVSPALGFNFSPDPQTHLIFTYLYSFKYYDHQISVNSNEHYDQTHAFNASLEHAFSERYKLVVSDSFAIGQEPDFLRAGNSFATFQRITGNNIRNYGSIAVDAQLTRLFGLEVGYNNAMYNYADNGTGDPNIDALNPSNSGRLDRMENTLHVDTKWVLQPETVGIIGAQYRSTSYTADEAIGVIVRPTPFGFIPQTIFSDTRNNREYSFYAGADHTFRPDLSGSLRAGGRYVDTYNDPSDSGSGWGPYVMLNLNWTYAPESRVELGVSTDMSATDLVGTTFGVSGLPNQTSFTAYSQATVIYGAVRHRICPRLRGSLIAQFQNSNYKGGAFDNEAEQDYLVGLNLTYEISPHLTAEAGYNYDRLESDIPGRQFDRNRVYIGATASY